jgi:hypothetical protein
MGAGQRRKGGRRQAGASGAPTGGDRGRTWKNLTPRAYISAGGRETRRDKIGGLAPPHLGENPRHAWIHGTHLHRPPSP